MTHLSMFTITRNPSDLPGVAFAVREHLVTSGGSTSGSLIGTAGTVDGARLLIPAAADHNLGRHPDDDPVIVETWI